MTTLKQRVVSLAESLGAKVETQKTDTSFEILVEAPKGMHWDEEVHELVCSQFSGFNTNDMWKEVLIRMQDGVEPCHSKCEWHE